MYMSVLVYTHNFNDICSIYVYVHVRERERERETDRARERERDRARERERERERENTTNKDKDRGKGDGEGASKMLGSSSRVQEVPSRELPIVSGSQPPPDMQHGVFMLFGT